MERWGQNSSFKKKSRHHHRTVDHVCKEINPMPTYSSVVLPASSLRRQTPSSRTGPSAKYACWCSRPSDLQQPAQKKSCEQITMFRQCSGRDTRDTFTNNRTRSYPGGVLSRLGVRFDGAVSSLQDQSRVMMGFWPEVRGIARLQ